jgi:hypothetical protein
MPSSLAMRVIDVICRAYDLNGCQAFIGTSAPPLGNSLPMGGLLERSSEGQVRGAMTRKTGEVFLIQSERSTR